MSHDNYLAPYRGELQAVYGYDSVVAFVTKHYEGQATALYRFNLEDLRLQQHALPCGAMALTADSNNNRLWLAAEDGYIYQSTLKKGQPNALKKLPMFESPVVTMTHLQGKCIAVLQANVLTLIDTATQTIQQQINLPLDDSATALAADVTGAYLALGMQSGEVAVYEYREQQLHFSAKAVLHQGKVTALQFEPNELRFFSAGDDKKLLSTHALGELEALDRGKKKNHTGIITAIVVGENRFFTVASDKSSKSWAYSGGTPVSVQHNLHKAIDATMISIEEQQYLVIANSDNSLRVVGINGEERFTELKHITRDGYAWARNEFQQSDPVIREQAVRFLLDYDDKKAIDLLKKQLKHERDKATRELIVTLASKAKHPHALSLLEDALCDRKHETIRRLAFTALEKRATKDDLRYLSLVLENNYHDIGQLALSKLAKLAKKQPRAEQLLLGALNHKEWRLRELALSVLETVYSKKDPKAGLQALQSRHADLQRAAMIRLFQRGLLTVIEVKRAIALLQDHNDALVRHTAFLVSILSQQKLTTLLKVREKDLARQLKELEDFELLADQQVAKPNLAQKIKAKISSKSTVSISELSHQDYVPLLQGMTSRYADICFTASFALAVLEDTRAFAMLLSLSHDRDADIRVGVCKAFAWLKQANSIEILQNLLQDSKTNVRDAAFSALQQVQQQPLAIAKVGLAIEHSDIQLRALTTLLESLQQNEAQASNDEALALLKAALNSPFAAIRQETFKTCFNRLLGGDTLQTLQLLLQSHYEDIHQEVLNELIAASQTKQTAQRATWVVVLLQQLVANNPFATIRQQAFELGIQQKKTFKPLTVLQAALASEFVDTRQGVLQHLISKPSTDNQPLLLPLLNDADRQLRHQALTALLTQQDSKAVLSHALDSQYEDIRVAAAKASAALGDPQAYAILLALATQPKPEKTEDKQRWQEAVISALQGLALLGDPRAFAVVSDFLKHKDKALVNAAAEALPMINAVEYQPELHALLKNDSQKIRAAAALALAYTASNYDANITTALMDSSVKRQLSRTQLLTAQVCLVQVTPHALQRFVIAEDSRLSSQFILLAYELLQQTDKPVLSIQSLAVEEPRLQRMGADLLSRYHDAEQCWQYAANWLNRAAGKESLRWAFTADMLQHYSAILVNAEPFIKVRFIALLQQWDQRVSMEHWQLSMAGFIARYKDNIPHYQAATPVEADAETIRHWHELAFGAYLGQLRTEQHDHELTQQLHAASLRGMRYLATHDAQLKPSVESCLLTLLNHANALIRQTAFDDLQTLKLDLEQLGNAATASPQSDIAKQGLKLLVDHYPVKKSLGLLHRLLTTGDEVLAIEAYRLLLDEEGLIKTASSALQSYTVSLRHECLSALAKQYDEKPAQQQLVAAVDNDHPEIVIKAARILARHQHPAIFAKLTVLLQQSHDQHQQKAILRALGQLKTTEVAVFLTDYLQQQKTARELPLDLIYPMIGRYRHPAVADTLLNRFAQHEKEQTLLFNCIAMISGYDQPIYDHVYNNDVDETDAPPKWLEKQHSRHHELLVRLFDTLLQCKQTQRAMNLLAALSWMPAGIPDAALLKAAPIVDLDFLKPLTTVIGWRFYKRDQPQSSTQLANGLLTLLTHQEADIQFLAAEALAKGGQTQGKAVLLSSIEYLDNIEYRQRAVLALGESADPQVLETLLTLAKDKEHVLQAAAVEAIGHMGANDVDEKLFKLLRNALRDASEYSDMVVHALNGLRWLNTLSAWQLIAETAQREYYYYRDHAIRCLRYWDSDYSRNLLLTLIEKDEDNDVVEVALKVAKQFWKPSKTAVNPVDFALLKGHYAFLDDSLVERISDYASISELFALLTADFAIHNENDDYIDEDNLAEHQQMLAGLRHALLQREAISEQDIAAQLASEKIISQAVAVQLLTRQSSMQAATQQQMTAVLQQRYQQWQAWHNERLQGQSHSTQQQVNFANLEALVKALLWCSISHQISSTTAIEVLQSNEKQYVVLQEHILSALLSQQQPLTTALSKAVTGLLQSPVLFLKSLANQVLSQQASPAQQSDLAWHYLVNQPNSATGDVFLNTIQQAAASDAEQALALPLLIARRDSATLISIADNQEHEETIRMGAIEALGRLADLKIEEKLSSISQNDNDEDISKAAYRALRRSQRARSKQNERPRVS